MQASNKYFYTSSQVVRWHNKPSIPSQTVAEHSFGMLQLLILFHPNPSANLMRAIVLHDLGERLSGDFPHDVKNDYPVLREIDEEIKKKFFEAFQIADVKLDAREKIWLKYLDQLEPYFYLVTYGDLNDEETHAIISLCEQKCKEYFEQLQAFGYFVEPDQENVH